MNENFRISENTISDCGIKPKTHHIFVSCASVAAIIQIIFYISFAAKLSLITSPIYYIPPVVVGVLMLLMGFLTQARNKVLHKTLVIAMLTAIVGWSVVVNSLLINITNILGIGLLILSAVQLIGSLYLYKKFGENAIFEVFFMAISIIENVVWASVALII